LENLKASSARTARTLEEVDEEMRLAARLQRDFLPRRLPEVGRARFGVLYRPANWVSGDIYDAVRLDETHLGFYVADVVGHGMPAALLTMFIKKALQTKRIFGNTYRIVPPDASLRELNVDICEQNLPSCQFCTAVYCVLDIETLKLTYSRGGHPEPVVIHPDGSVDLLWAEGSLLGIFEQERYELAEYQLEEGDRLVLYTDGAEQLLRTMPGGEEVLIQDSLAYWGGLAREEMLLQMSTLIDSRTVDPAHVDDITMLVLDVES
jgi:sigma-B regulation protein RsbU (phosphoserine phosphatase)